MTRTHKEFQFLDSININNLDDVAKALQTLNRIFAGSNLLHLQNFNTTYLIITQNVRAAMQQKAFNDPEFLRQFDIRFAAYYFDALRNYLLDKEVPPSWRRAFDYCRNDNPSSLKSMALGVNAHINNDIPQVLRDCSAENKHRDDYKRINGIINQSIHTVIRNLHYDERLLSPKRHPLRPIYKLGMSAIVPLWRGRAWHNFRRMQQKELSVHDLEQRSALIAGGLLKLPV